MPDPTPPTFVKNHHHYVSQFWLKHFRDVNNALWRRQKDDGVSRAPLDETMSEKWLYAVFDDWWRPSDDLEDYFGPFETTAGQTFRNIMTSTTAPTDKEWAHLVLFLALTTTRHPDTMERGGVRARDLGWMLADVHSYADEASFATAAKAEFGFDIPSDFYAALKSVSPEQLLQEAAAVDGLSPQSPQLPQYESIRATLLVARTIVLMDLVIMDAPPGHPYILGDRPIPLREMGKGFTVPLSSNVAVMCTPSSDASQWQRKAATAAFVASVNDDQWQRSKNTIVGADPAQLATFTL